MMSIKDHCDKNISQSFRNPSKNDFFQASTVFHTFHSGSKKAYKWLQELKEKCPTQTPDIKEDKVRFSIFLY